MMAGFQLHLSKPVQMAELIAAISAHYRHASAGPSAPATEDRR
jgi:ATP-binding cassette, subfamily B, bacterial